MKIVKGTKWLKRNFLKQLERLLEHNHVVELNELVDFEGRKQFVKNMLIRMEIEAATEIDIEKQAELDRITEKAALKDAKYQDKLKQEEKQLQEKMGI